MVEKLKCGHTAMYFDGPITTIFSAFLRRAGNATHFDIFDKIQKTGKFL
jgi:hypothetical protein